jgi:hypothetical protein
MCYRFHGMRTQHVTQPIEPMLSAASYAPLRQAQGRLLHKSQEQGTATLTMSARSKARATRARMATPFQERSPCQTASYPRVRRAFTGKACCSALSSWRLTTSRSAFANQASRLSSRLLMLLMLKVATFSGSLSGPALLGVPERDSRVRSRYSLYPDPSQPHKRFLSNVQFWSESAIGQKPTP